MTSRGTRLVNRGHLALEPRTDEGFSLIEALVTVALVSVLAGIVVPSVAAGMARYEVISASQQIVSTVRRARFEAVAQNRVHYVRFDTDADEYQIRRMEGGVEVDADAAQSLPQTIAFADGAEDIQINADGRVAAARTITITNGDADNNQTITVSASGRVQLD